METLTVEKEINWANDFGINEELHFFANKISAKYGTLYYENQEHPLAQEWNKKGLEWNEFNNSIKDLVLQTKEQADNLVDKLTKSYKEVEQLLFDINKKKVS